MKQLLYSCFLLAAAGVPAVAHLFAAPTLGRVADSDAVYLVEVVTAAPGPDSVHNAKVTFSVTEVLRGPSRTSFELLLYEGGPIKQGSQVILFHNPSGFKGCFGWAMEGDCEWLPISVTGEGDGTTAEWLGSLDKVRGYLREHPQKS